jgi:hypothetical protein
MNDTSEALREYCKGKSYNDLVGLMLELKDHHAELKAKTAEAWKNLCLVTDGIIPERMDADQIQNITVILPDGSKRRLTVLDQVSVKTPPDKKGELWSWLREHGAEDLITETVNSSTLAGFVRQQLEAGDEWPADICDVSTYSRASLRKA